jgi:hypothetical protein
MICTCMLDLLQKCISEQLLVDKYAPWIFNSYLLVLHGLEPKNNFNMPLNVTSVEPLLCHKLEQK